MTEQEIQTRIKNRLTSKGWLVVKLIQCSINGMPDLMALRDGRALFIEVKRPGQRPSELQKYRMKQLAAHGFIALLATDVKDIEHL